MGADVGRGLQWRMDHETPYLADHFINQIRHWRLTPSFAFVEQPQPNGVAERFNWTLKEPVVHGRILRTLEDLRATVAAFVERYNAHWRVEKLGILTPNEARSQYALVAAA